jgi:hypothetical protein
VVRRQHILNGHDVLNTKVKVNCMYHVNFFDVHLNYFQKIFRNNLHVESSSIDSKPVCIPPSNLERVPHRFRILAKTARALTITGYASLW